jgi:hypothetical protein
VVNAVAQMDKAYAAELKEVGVGFGDKGSTQADRSQNNGNIIAIDSRAAKEDAVTFQEKQVDFGAFLINHGAGHNAGLNHAGEDVMTPAGKLSVPTISVMVGGEDIADSVLSKTGLSQNWGYAPGVNGFISSPSNLHGVIHQSFLKRFGNNKAKANLPTAE